MCNIQCGLFIAAESKALCRSLQQKKLLVLVEITSFLSDFAQQRCACSFHILRPSLPPSRSAKSRPRSCQRDSRRWSKCANAFLLSSVPLSFARRVFIYPHTFFTILLLFVERLQCRFYIVSARF